MPYPQRLAKGACTKTKFFEVLNCRGLTTSMSEQTRITSRAVANLAGVSQSTVSRVFTPGASVSTKTVKKVLKAAEHLGYRPNVLARAVVSGRSKLVGVIVAYLDNQFYPAMLEKLSNLLQAEGYHVLIFMAAQTSENIDKVVEEILDFQVDGIVAASVALSSELSDRCQNVGIPIVLINRMQDISSISSVTSANWDGGRKAAEFLVQGGHKKFGYIAGWEGASTQRDREAGFIAGLNNAGFDLHAREVGNFMWGEACEATLRMFSQDPPDAVFVANDHMAMAVMDTLRFDLGFNVPKDVSVIGYDDVSTASWKEYDLTTIRQPAEQMVSETVKVLLSEIQNQNALPCHLEIGGSLVVRGSARLPT